MNKNTYYGQQISRRRRIKFGALAIGITAAVIALVIAINAIFSSLAMRYTWFVDMTDENLFSISQQTRDLINGCKKENKITVYFCSSADELDSAESTSLVHKLVKEYADEYDDFISVEYLDIINHPDSVPLGMKEVSDIKQSDVIISNGITPKLLSIESFYITDTEENKVWAFNGEYRLNISILQYEETATAYFTEGHGEDTESSQLWALFVDAGFDVKTIDLGKETPEAGASVMVINCPKKDFLGAYDGVNEISKIDGFLDGNGGLMVFLDASCPDTPELDEFLTEWGIVFENRLVRDYDNSIPGSDGKTLYADYVKEGTGSSLTSTLTALASLPRTVVDNARPISTLWETAAFGNSSRMVAPVLTTFDTSRTESLDGAGGIQEGSFNLMTITVDSRYINNEPNYSYVLAAGSSSFADDAFLKNSYGNRDLMFYIMRVFGKRAAPFDSYEWLKPFDDTTLTATAGQANRMTVVLVAIVPVIVFAVGYGVYRRRRFL